MLSSVIYSAQPSRYPSSSSFSGCKYWLTHSPNLVCNCCHLYWCIYLRFQLVMPFAASSSSSISSQSTPSQLSMPFLKSWKTSRSSHWICHHVMTSAPSSSDACSSKTWVQRGSYFLVFSVSFLSSAQSWRVII